MHRLFLVLVFAIMAFTAAAQPNCSALSTGFTPINDLGQGIFNNAWGVNWQGGLFPNGSNSMPTAHKAAGLSNASQIECLNSSGNPDVNGKIVWLSIGMSNTTQESQQFITLANANPNKNPKVVLVNGAQGGKSASIISSPWNPGYSNYWNVVNNRLTTAGVTANQVQVIWLKEADQATNYTSVRPYYDSLVVMLPRILNDIKVRFPNVKICYLASRISARYANTMLNPEPYSYYTGWAVKNVIERQINGDPQLQHSGPNAKAPWVSWGIYMWSDGSTPQVANPQIFMTCPADFQSDGTHPSTVGTQKVASWLLDFFTTDSTAIPWFLSNGCATISSIPKTNKIYSSVTIYPNPVHNSFYLELDEELSNGYITLYDIWGKVVMKVKLSGETNLRLETKNLPNGIYFLTVLSEKRRVTKKILKN